MKLQPLSYGAEFENFDLSRSGSGLLVVRLHSDGRSLLYSRSVHEQFPKLLYRIIDDPANNVVILTGTGDDMMADVDVTTWGDPRVGEGFDGLFRHAKRLFDAMLDIEIPVISAVNGPVRIHAYFPLMADIILASENALFQDNTHWRRGKVPSDGANILWPLWIGPIRARYFLMTSQEIHAREAFELGIVNEVLKSEGLLPRALELAETLLECPRPTRRYTRTAMNMQYRNALGADLSESMLLQRLVLENAGHLQSLGKPD